MPDQPQTDPWKNNMVPAVSYASRRGPSAATVPESGAMPLVGTGGTVGATGAEMIAAERLRQVTEEKWSYRHDDKHRGNELARAAISYIHAVATPDEWAAERGKLPHSTDEWPWSEQWWKPSKDPVRNLVKAGALIAAEIDRLTRAAKKTRGPNGRSEP